MLENKNFFRGDSVPDVVQNAKEKKRHKESFAKYYSEGLLANNSISLDQLEYQFAYLVAAHVWHKNRPAEKLIYDKTPFFSFTTKKTAAFFFMEGGEDKNLTECDFFKATHFIWKLNELSAYAYPWDKTRGIYQFEYHASTKDFDEHLQRLISGNDSDRIKAATIIPVYNHIKNDTSVHCALLIDATTYLSEHPSIMRSHPELVKLAIEKAVEHEEWLLLPFDSGPNGQGYSARFHLNDHLCLWKWFKES